MNKIILLAVLLMGNLVTAQNDNCNCCTSEHEAFDFWIGDWNVTNPQGIKVGENKIIKIQSNCLLVENWVSSNGQSTGMSQNFYNRKTKQWEQLWVDNQGGNLKLKGNRVGNQMILRTDDEVNQEGIKFFHRVTWTANPDGSVRQVWETIVDNDKPTVVFDGLYKKKSE